jgi:hypothetical protein
MLRDMIQQHSWGVEGNILQVGVLCHGGLIVCVTDILGLYRKHLHALIFGVSRNLKGIHC